MRYVDLLLNDTGAALANLIAGTKLTLKKYPLTGPGPGVTPTPVPLAAGSLTALDHAIELDFGKGGIGNTPSSPLSDGYYELDADLRTTVNGATVGAVAQAFFYRLFGDVNGDGKVDATDVQRITDVIGQVLTDPALRQSADANGDGAVNQTDRTLTNNAKGHKLATGLLLGLKK